MNSKNTFLKLILAFFNAFFLFGAVLFLVLSLLSLKKTVLFVAEKSDYNKKTAIEAEKQMNFIALAGGFGDEFFEGILTNSNNENDLEKFVENAFESSTFEPENKDVEEKINKKIFDFAESKMHGFSLETKGILEETARLCISETKGAFYPDIMRYFCAFLGRFNKLFLGVFSVFAVLFSTSCFLLSRQGRSGLKTSFLSASFMCGAGPIFILVLLRGKTLGIAHLWLKDFFKMYLNLALICLIVFAFFILTIALCIKKRPVSK